MEALGSHSRYFQLRYYVIGKRGLIPLTKRIVIMRMLAYSIETDCVDEYLKTASTTLDMHEKVFLKCHKGVWGRVLKKTKSS